MRCKISKAGPTHPRNNNVNMRGHPLSWALPLIFHRSCFVQAYSGILAAEFTSKRRKDIQFMPRSAATVHVVTNAELVRSNKEHLRVCMVDIS